MGGQISWLLPAALIALAALVWLSWRRQRTDRVRAAALLWGGWLIVTGLVFSYMSGIIHPYYTVALAPAIGALTGIGAVAVWRARRSMIGGRPLAARAVLAAALVVTAWWAYRAARPLGGWLPWLRPLVLVCGLAAAVVVIAERWLPAGSVLLSVAPLALVAGLAGPLAYSLTPRPPRTPARCPAPGRPSPPSAAQAAGPAAVAGPSGRRRAPGSAAGAALVRAALASRRGPRSPPGWRGTPPGCPGGTSGRPGADLREHHRAPSGQHVRTAGRLPRWPGRRHRRRPGRQHPGFQRHHHAADQRGHRLPLGAATVGAESAAPFQLASGEPIMAVGGFNGTDQAPTLAQFKKMVAAHEVHYFIGANGHSFGGGSGDAAQITSWVESHFTKQTIGGQTIYNLTHPTNPCPPRAPAAWYPPGRGCDQGAVPTTLASHPRGRTHACRPRGRRPRGPGRRPAPAARG